MHRSIAAAERAGGITEGSLIERIVREHLEDVGFGLWVPLPPHVHAQLRELAKLRKQPLWKVAGLLIDQSLRQSPPPGAGDGGQPGPTDDAHG